MKTLIHRQNDTNICIYDMKDNYLRGSFFKEKPKQGDVILSWCRHDTNFLYVYEVKSIISNNDALISKDCKKNPEMANFELEIENVTNDERFEEFDNSIQNNL